jgi:hypothetical protein
MAPSIVAVADRQRACICISASSSCSVQLPHLLNALQLPFCDAFKAAWQASKRFWLLLLPPLMG